MHNAKRTIAIFLVLCLLVSVLPMSALAINITDKPENGTTEGQPFPAGTGGSANFRIPGIVTLNDGTLVAACDARWNHTGDGAGLDTIVSVSKDNGENWEYTFANYLGDNGDTYNNLSTCIIDPAIGTDGETVYLIADLWPAGIALNTSRYAPVAGENGFDENGNLLLRDLAGDTVTIGTDGYNTMAAAREYNYYLDLETLELCSADGTAVEGYTVDAYFNITGTDGTNTNLFFSDSPYQPYPTDYLYMTTSEDGLNWSVPTLLNLQEENEQTLLVGPGNGTYDAVNDRVIFTAYEYTSGYQRTSLIWMDSNGGWYRSEDCTDTTWSSEASAVVLDDGTVRVFYRDTYSYLRYTDMIWDEEEQNYVCDPNASEVATAAVKTYNCQLTAIKYSQQIKGKDAIIVAAPTGSSGSRRDGHIYIFLVNDDKSLELAYSYDITPDEVEYYAYSCLTELDDGNLGLLWESYWSASGKSDITYTAIDMDAVMTRDNDPSLTVKEVELLEGYSKTFTDNSGYYADADTSELDTNVAELVMTGGETTTNAAQVLGSGANIDLDSCQYTFTATDDGYFEVSATADDGTTVYLNHYSTTSNSIPNVTSPAGKIDVQTSAHEDMFKLVAQNIDGGSGAARGLHFHAEADTPYWNRCGNDTTYKCHEYLYRKAAEGETASTEIPGYVRITTLDDVVDGGQYLIAAKNDAGNWYVLNPSTSTTVLNHIAQVMGSTTVGYTELTFTGVAAGYTEVLIGSTIYKITVHNVDEVEVNLPIGGVAVFTEASGNYADADTSALDTSVATVELTGIDGTTDNGLSLAPITELVDGGKYVIFNTRAAKAVTNAPATAAAAAGAGSGLSLDGTTDSFNADVAVWTITAVEGGYTAQDADGMYMTIGSTTAGITDTATTLAMNYGGSTWTIAKDGAYLNHFGGGSSTCAAGWQNSAAASDAGSQFDIYTYTDEPHGASTQVVFTGVGVGTTEVLIGRTLYKITVTEEAPACEHTNTEVRNAAEATCTEDGYTGDTYCLSCGEKVAEGETIPATGHSFGEWTVVEEATCTEGGLEERVCATCSEKETRVIEANCPSEVYSDVPVGEWYHDAVDYVTEQGIMNGMGGGLFEPGSTTNRAQIAVILYRLEGSPSVEGLDNPFTDVPAGDWYTDAVIWAASEGVVKGMSETTFEPAAPVTRAQLVTMLYRYVGSPEVDHSVLEDYTDADELYYATDAFAWAIANGIVNGMTETTLGPNGTANRAQIAVILYRYLSK